MSIMRKIRGTIETIFRIGLSGPQVKNSSGVIEVRDATDAAYAIVRGATPVAANDLVTKAYADSLEKPLVVKRQADCTSSLPDNTAVAGYVAVTTAGTGAAVGDLLYDDGLNTGTMTISAATEGRAIVVTDDLTGGTIYLLRDSIYVWDADGSAWVIAKESGKLLIVARQADCSSAIPDNTGANGYVVVTTAGNGAVVGNVLYDNGSSTGLMTIVSAVDGRLISVTLALTGGTVAFDVNSLYSWDTTGSAWAKIGDISGASVDGVLKKIQFDLALISKDSTAAISAQVIEKVSLIISTAYTAGALISIGSVAAPTGLMLTTENDAQAAGVYEIDFPADGVASTLAELRATFSGTTAVVGAGKVSVIFAAPLI